MKVNTTKNSESEPANDLESDTNTDLGRNVVEGANGNEGAVGNEGSAASRTRMSPARTVVQIFGFVVGMGLLGWCIKSAVGGGDLSRLSSATAFQISMLIGCTLISVVANGAIFWIIIRPVMNIPLKDIQLVNCVVNLANYLPFRFGMITRIAHHRRVDHVSYFLLAAWYAAVMVMLMLVLVAILGATLVRPAADVWWFVSLASILVIGMFFLRYVVSHHKLTPRLRGAERMLNHPSALIGAVILRLIDLAAYGGRLYFSLSIIGVAISFRDWLYLTNISIVSSLSPVGSLGFREFAISYLGPYLTSSKLQGEGLHDQLSAVVVIDRSAEMMVFIPLGLLSVFWMLYRWRLAGRTEDLPVIADSSIDGPDDD